MKTVIIVVSSFALDVQPKVDFQFSDSIDLYIVSSLAAFKEYVFSLIQSERRGSGRLIVIPEYQSNGDFFNIMEVLKQTTGKGGTERDEDVLPFDLVTILWDNDDPLAPQTIHLQQVLRVITNVHKGLFVCLEKQYPFHSISGVEGIVEKLNNSEAQPVFDTKNKLRLIIPPGWDSWSKIKLLASTNQQGTTPVRLLSEDGDFEACVSTYKNNEMLQPNQIAVDRNRQKDGKDTQVSYQEFLRSLALPVRN